MKSNNRLSLTIRNREHLVSNISSVLRTLQAAIRESGDNMTDKSPKEKIVLVLLTTTDKQSCIYSFYFRSKGDFDSNKYSKKIFTSFIVRVDEELKSSSQKTLWGTSVKSIKETERDAINNRLRLFLSDFSRLGIARLEFQNKKFILEDGNILPSG